MREYKFRAWDEECGRMYSGDEIESRADLITSLSYGGLVIFRATPHGDYEQLQPLQYTGLKDNVSDEEWYEGDILTPNPHSERTELEVICFDIHQGKYKSVPMSLYLSNAGNGGWTGYDVKCYQKRVGNIYDHKHLLNLPGEVDHE
ncbi:YopX family protein [Paenibacillus sp. Marseille-Q4541]|uniref:YopX family protein n=1 Tax=Paenibacillus sp. Marseille-Q4541 TaxID=2831522 RepID=UPI001BA72436|nr:YopX family protein [Paenibacillus sp. Marseille-Q4541]